MGCFSSKEATAHGGPREREVAALKRLVWKSDQPVTRAEIKVRWVRRRRWRRCVRIGCTGETMCIGDRGPALTRRAPANPPTAAAGRVLGHPALLRRQQR
jgi:hypothetical protein